MRISNLSVKPGDCIRLKAKIHSGAKSFAINLGQDEFNLAIHFNVRFEAVGDVKKIVCNSRTNGNWGTEMRPSLFPFHEGAETKIHMSFHHEEIKVKINGEKEIQFPNRLGMNSAQYFSVEGDVSAVSLKFA
ncbi:16 kDa beta-galactoside-binding lectin-like [Liasis olivaceus]